MISKLPLKDIATIVKRYEDSSTLASMNGKNSITLAISQNPKGNALTIAEDIKKFISDMRVDGVEFSVRMDKSTIIKDRLNIVVSNILLGLYLSPFNSYFDQYTYSLYHCFGYSYIFCYWCDIFLLYGL